MASCEVCSDGQVPLYWRIAVSEHAGFMPELVAERIKQVLGDDSNVYERQVATLGVRGQPVIPRKRFRSSREWEQDPHITLLYVGGQDLESAANSNGITLEQFEEYHAKLCALHGKEVELFLEGAMETDDFVVAQIRLPDAVPCPQSPPSTMLATCVGVSPLEVTDFFLAARSLHRIEPPLMLQGFVEVVTARPRSLLQKAFALRRKDDILEALQCQPESGRMYQETSQSGLVEVSSHHLLMSRGMAHAHVKAGAFSCWLRDQVASLCTSVRPLTTKGHDGSRLQTEGGLLVEEHGRELLRFAESSKGSQRSVYGRTSLLPGIANGIDGIIVPLLKQKTRENLHLFLCALRTRYWDVYKLRGVWDRVAGLLVIM